MCQPTINEYDDDDELFLAMTHILFVAQRHVLSLVAHPINSGIFRLPVIPSSRQPEITSTTVVNYDGLQ